MQKLRQVESTETVTRAINEIMDAMMWLHPSFNPDLGKTEPPAAYRVDGLTAYANGSDWNPGGGRGIYRWSVSATATWVLIG